MYLAMRHFAVAVLATSALITHAFKFQHLVQAAPTSLPRRHKWALWQVGSETDLVEGPVLHELAVFEHFHKEVLACITLVICNSDIVSIHVVSAGATWDTGVLGGLVGITWRNGCLGGLLQRQPAFLAGLSCISNGVLEHWCWLTIDSNLRAFERTLESVSVNLLEKGST